MQFHTVVKFVFLLFFSIFPSIRSESECQLIINEINVLDPKKPEKNEYIELKTSCDKSIPLRGYKLIGINSQSKTGSVDLIVTLWNERTNANGFFTIGGSEVSTADLKVPHDMVKFKSSFTGKSSVFNFMSNREIRAIGLLHDSKSLNTFGDFVLTNKQPIVKINSDILAQLKKHLIDLVVYARDKACDKCELFEKIRDDFVSKKYILREFEKNAANNDITLNRCAVDSQGFVPEKFKLGNPTPGSDNDCSGPHFILEEHILDVISPVNTQSPYADDFDDLDGAGCSNQCTSSISQTNYNLINQTMLDEAVSRSNDTARSDVCTNLMLNPDGANTGMQVDQANNRKRRINDGQDYSEELEWKTTTFFRAWWIDKIKTHQNEFIPIDVVEENKVWFEYLFNSTSPKDSTYRCRICYKYYDEFNLQQRYKTTFADEKGSLRTRKYDNKNAIAEHAKHVSHITIIQKLEEKAAKRLILCH